MNQQMNLDIDAKRSRVRLQDTPATRRRVVLNEYETRKLVRQMVKEVEALTLGPLPVSGAVVAITHVTLQDGRIVPAPVTDWVPCDQPPPRSGIWEVRDPNHTMTLRFSYCAETERWQDLAAWPFPRVLHAGYSWRGLAVDPATL